MAVNYHLNPSSSNTLYLLAVDSEDIRLAASGNTDDESNITKPGNNICLYMRFGIFPSISI